MLGEIRVEKQISLVFRLWENVDGGKEIYLSSNKDKIIANNILRNINQKTVNME